MRFGKTILILFAAAVVSLSCDRSPSTDPAAVRTTSDANPAPPQEAQSSGESAKSSPTTRPAAVMLVDGEPKEFPASRLVVEDRNGKTVALLMSEDPPAAINDDFLGNSYYLELEFDDQLPTVRGQVWEYEALDSEKQDTPSGLFLQGNHWQLQPFQVRVQFQQVDGADVAWISGTFHMYRAGEHPPMPRLVPVTGRVPVTLP